MNLHRTALYASAAALFLSVSAQAEDIKIGFISTFSGPFAHAGDYAEKGVELYMSMHPDAFAGHTVEIIKRDDTGPNADVARRLAQELVVQDKVDLIMGLQFTPNAFAALDIANKAHIPVVIHNAATSSITEASPYAVRVARTMWASAFPLGTYAYEDMGARTAAVLYSDYAPGKDAKDAFVRSFTDAGGKIIDDVPLPFPQTPDFTPFLQRLKLAAPDVIFAFVPTGKYAQTFVKTYDTIGLKQVSKLIGPFDIAPPAELPMMGDGIDGVVIAGHYAESLDNPANKAFVDAWHMAYPDLEIDPFAVQSFDSMAAISHAVQATGGKFDGDSFIAALKGWSTDSPRGPLSIDPDSRDAVQTQYIMEIHKDEGGKYVPVVVKAYPGIGDPWKDLKIGK